jgi:hypothetical protein
MPENHQKTPDEILRSIREHRNGRDQATGELARLQDRLDLTGDDVTRVLLQCGYALGWVHASLRRPAQLRAEALAWTVIGELFTAPGRPFVIRTDETAFTRGDPSRPGYRQALKDSGLVPPDQLALVGDDPLPDPGGRYIVGGDGIPYGPFPPEETRP